MLNINNLISKNKRNISKNVCNKMKALYCNTQDAGMTVPLKTSYAYIRLMLPAC